MPFRGDIADEVCSNLNNERTLKNIIINKIIFKGKQNIQWNFRWNYYKGTLLVRINDNGLFLYDIINIKKETSTPRES